MTTFGEALKLDRERMKLSQDQLAQMLEVSQQAVAGWESGKSHPRKSHMARLLEILGAESILAKSPPRYHFVISNSASGFTRTGIKLDDRPSIYSQRFDRRIALEELKDALPDSLRKNVGRSIRYGHVERQYDYVSAGVVARVMPSTQMNNMPHALTVTTNVVRLAMAVERIPGPAPTSSVVLFILSSESPTRVMKWIEPNAFDASTLGVTVQVVPDTTAMANAIVELEAVYVDQLQEFNEWMERNEQEAARHFAEMDEMPPPDYDPPPNE